MKHIRQKHFLGCGIACVAMVSGMSYKQVLDFCYPLRWFWQRVRPIFIGATLTDMSIRHREVVGHEYLNNITHTAILVVKHTEVEKKWNWPFDGTGYHAVVWDPETHTVLDPGLNASEPLRYYQERLVGYYIIFKDWFEEACYEEEKEVNWEKEDPQD